jgi:hypothetical protein
VRKIVIGSGLEHEVKYVAEPAAFYILTKRAGVMMDDYGQLFAP